LLAVAEHMSIQNELIPRIATGFCGGLAYTGGNCGAVSGGIMAIGLLLGRSAPTDQKNRCYEAVRAFLEGFLAQFGTLSCPELTGVDLGTPEGHAAFVEKGQRWECTHYVDEATRMVMELLMSKPDDQVEDIKLISPSHEK